MAKDERLSEQETVLRWDGHKDMVSVYTASKAVRGKLLRSGLTPYNTSRIRGREVGWFFQFPYVRLSWGARRSKNPVRKATFRGKMGVPGSRP